jgi:hypothetical protein
MQPTRLWFFTPACGTSERMTIAGINPRSHVAEGFDASSIYTAGGIGQGAAAFSAFVAIRPKTMNLAEQRLIFGNPLVGTGGWSIGRFATVFNDIDLFAAASDNASSGASTVSLKGYSALDRILLLGFNYTEDIESGFVTPYLNGVPYGAPTATPLLTAGAGLMLGGDTATGLGTKEGVIGAGYRESLLSDDDWEAIWRTLRHHGNLESAEMPSLLLRYETRNLLPQEGLQPVPVIWPNTGTLGGAGDLSRAEGAASLTFLDENNPAYATP